MPKAKLEFDLPQEQVEFNLAVNAVNWKYTLYDFDQWLRSELKYNDARQDADCVIIQEVRDRLWKFLDDRNLDFDE